MFLAEAAAALRSSALPKYLLGELSLAPGEVADGAEYEEDLGEGQFFSTLKRRVEAYFKDNKARTPLCHARSLTALTRRRASWTRASTRPCT